MLAFDPLKQFKRCGSGNRIRAGDEIVAVNGISVKGERKSTVAQLIQCSTNPVKITINKLEADSSKGKTLDIIMKKIKHKIVEFMDTDSVDALGLSRAILCNDPLLKKMKILEDNTLLYRNMIGYFEDLFYLQEKVSQYQKEFGDIFCELAAHEAHANANEAFSEFGVAHRRLSKKQSDSLSNLRPLIADLVTYVDKVVPDTQLTLKKYLDVKYEYLSYCLKLKEMDDEELEYHTLNEGLYRVETGNYEYRLMLRCRQEAREKFVQMRNDVMIKIELLDQKHVRDIALHLANLASVMKNCLAECSSLLQNTQNSPVEIDITQGGAELDLHENSTEDCSDSANEFIEEPLIATSPHGEMVNAINLIDIN
uniref:PRKCA-binding protein n=1 Tax=Angiostrongylus cantonensis TaxID=6313 RepID=A0A0K0DCH6_ANGCA